MSSRKRIRECLSVDNGRKVLRSLTTICIPEEKPSKDCPETPPVLVSCMQPHSVDGAFLDLQPLPQLLLGSMDSNDHAVTAAALQKLNELCEPSETDTDCKRDESFGLGGHFCVMRIMIKWNSSSSTQVACCRSIINLSWKHLACKRSFVKLGAPATIIDAMKKFPASKEMQKHGLEALNALFQGQNDGTGNDDTISNLAHKLVQQLNCIVVVVCIMGRFENDAEIQLEGCKFFGNIVQVDELLDTAIAAGAAAAAGRSLQKHLRNGDVKESVNKLMKRLFSAV